MAGAGTTAEVNAAAQIIQVGKQVLVLLPKVRVPLKKVQEIQKTHGGKTCKHGRRLQSTYIPKRLNEALADIAETASSCSECGNPVILHYPEEKQKGVDGKVCWKGYKRMGTKKKGGKTVDNCVKM